MKALLALALVVPAFAEQAEIRRGGPFVVQKQMLDLTVPIPPKDDFLRGVVAYRVTLHFFDGVGRFEMLRKFVAAPTCHPGEANEGTEVTFQVPLTYQDAKATIERLAVDSKETLP